MTESRGAMTAQQKLKKLIESHVRLAANPHLHAEITEVAESWALSAHNTALFTDLMVEFDIPDTDALKHRLEDHKRWSKVVVEQDIALAELRARLARYEAKEACLPPLFDIADDCSATLALEIVELRQRLTDYESAERKNELLIQTIESLRSQGAGQWISVEERLPEFTGTYLVSVTGPTDAGDDCTATLPADWSPSARQWHELRGWGHSEVTHWQPPPSAPGLASPPQAAGSRTEILLSAARVNCEFCRQGREVFKAGDNWEHPYEGGSTQCRSAEIRRLIGGQP